MAQILYRSLDPPIKNGVKTNMAKMIRKRGGKDTIFVELPNFPNFCTKFDPLNIVFKRPVSYHFTG